MKKVCTSCGKGTIMARKRNLLRGKYNPTDKKRKFPNLQWLTVDGERTKVCTSCVKTQSKKPRVRTGKKPAKAKTK